VTIARRKSSGFPERAAFGRLFFVSPPVSAGRENRIAAARRSFFGPEVTLLYNPVTK
jgi:hypothetical protein